MNKRTKYFLLLRHFKGAMSHLKIQENDIVLTFKVLATYFVMKLKNVYYVNGLKYNFSNEYQICAKVNEVVQMMILFEAQECKTC